MVKRFPKDESGQGTLEYAIVTSIFIAMFVALSQLGHLAADGELVDHANDSASHQVQATSSALGDAILY